MSDSYTILMAATAIELEQLVMRAMAAGWVPLGGVAIGGKVRVETARGAQDVTPALMQAMTKKG